MAKQPGNLRQKKPNDFERRVSEKRSVSLGFARCAVQKFAKNGEPKGRVFQSFTFSPVCCSFRHPRNQNLKKSRKPSRFESPTQYSENLRNSSFRFTVFPTSPELPPTCSSFRAAKSFGFFCRWLHPATEMIGF